MSSEHSRPSTRSTLSTGTTVVSKQLTSVESVAFGLYFPTGSRFETAENNGISHFIEHLVFKGTKRRSAEQINREIDLLGGVSNAYTTKESICFYARVLGDHLERIFDFYADLAVAALPDGIETEVERERDVILQEISAVEDSPEELVGELVDRAYFAEHALALPVVGSVKAVSRLDLGAIRGHLKHHFVAQDLVVAACGNVDHDELCALTETHLADLPTGGTRVSLHAPRPVAATQIAQRDLEQVQICLSAPGVSRSDPRRAVADVLNAITGDGFSSRLFREVRDRRGLAYSVYSSFSSYMDSGTFNVSFGVAPSKVGEALDVVSRVLAEVRDSGVQAAEVDQAKTLIHGSTVLAHESNTALLGYIADKTLLGEDDLELESDLAELADVRREQVHSLAEELFSGPWALAAVGPVDRDQLPATGWELP